MKINSYQSIPKINVKFTSLYGELPKELSPLQKEFTKYASEFMLDKAGYDVFLYTTKNSKKLMMQGNAGFLNKATTKNELTKIKSLKDLKDMLSDNYLTIQAGQDILGEISKVGNYFTI